MGLRDWLTEPYFGQKALTGTPAVLEALHQRQLNTYIPLGGTNLSAQRINGVYVAVQNGTYGWIYRSQPSVRRVIEYLAGNVAQLGLKLYERVDDDDRRQVGDHPAAEVMRRPNPHTPGKQFIKAFVKNFLIYDNAYAIKLRPDGEELVIVGLSPAMVGIVGRSFFAPEAYRVYRMDGSSFDVPPEDMIHWRGEDPDDPRRGTSKLDTLREELASDAANRQAGAELSRSGLSLPGWIERPVEAPEWSEEARKRFEEDWANRAKQGKRKSPVLEEGMVFKQGGVTPEDAELLATRRATMDYVASLYGMKNVPPESDEERRQFYTDVLPDITGQVCDFLGLQLLEAEFGLDDYYFEFSLDEKLMGDDRIKALTSAAGAPIMLRDEARSHLNLPALPDGIGQEPVTPLNVLVGGKPTPQTMPIQDPNKPSQDGDARPNAPLPAGAASLNGKALLLPRRAAKERRRNEAAADFQDVIRGFLSHMERSLKSRGMDQKAVDDERWNERLANELEQSARRAVRREGEVTAARLAAGFDMARTKNYLRTVSESKAHQVVAALRAALTGAGLMGDDPSEVFKVAREVETPRAAMTLATSLTTFATLEAARQDPESDGRMKTWIVTSSNSDHPEMDGESVPLGESFSNGEDGPPADHPGCQCLLEIDGGGHPPVKAMPVETKQAPMQPTFNLTMPEITVMLPSLNVPEGAVKVEPTVIVEPSPAPEVNVTTGETHVAPAEVRFEKGAMESVVNVEAAPAPEVNIESPIHVEAAPPADVRIAEGAVQVDVVSPDVTIEAAPAPNVNVEVKGSGKKIMKLLRNEEGRPTGVEIEEENE